MISGKMCYVNVGAMVVLLALPSLYALSLRDLENFTTLQHLKEEIVTKHPELVKWFERASLRLKSGANATEDDLDDVRNLLKGARQQVHDFVNSPTFALVTTIMIEEVVYKIEPLLGVMPLKEVKDFYNIVAKDPKLMKIVFESDEDIADIMPGGTDLKQWLSNSTQHIVEESLKNAEGAEEEDY